jgi:hypothetical protein
MFFLQLGQPQAIGLEEFLAAFDSKMVFWLVSILVADFATGVVLALKKNTFDWAKTFDIAKKQLIIATAWGAGFALGPDIGNTVYGLSVAYITGSVMGNLVELLDIKPTGIVGQFLSKGPGDATIIGSTTSKKVPAPPSAVANKIFPRTTIGE